MKRTFKVLLSAIILTVMLFAIATVSYADVSEVYETENGSLCADAPTEQNEPTVNESNVEEELSENVFSAIFEQIKSYATEIFCAMTFIGSLILAYAYKKGLLPLIEKTLLSIGSSVSKIKERTESGAVATEELGASITAKLENSEALVNNMIDKIGEMNAELSQIKTSELERTDNCKELSIIVSTQIDMLYDIFMSSALPQYQKDAVGEKVAKMKEMLKENDKKK